MTPDERAEARKMVNDWNSGKGVPIGKPLELLELAIVHIDEAERLRAEAARVRQEKPAEPWKPKVGERVRVKKVLGRTDATTDAAEAVHLGECGVITVAWTYNSCILLDSGVEVNCWTVNIEPAPVEKPAKFQVGQLVESRNGLRGRIESVDESMFGPMVRWYPEGEKPFSCRLGATLKPCSPVCTAEQKSILPGDEVQVDDVLVDNYGVPFDDFRQARIEGGVIEIPSRWTVKIQTPFGEIRTVYRWNIARIVKPGPDGPGGGA